MAGANWADGTVSWADNSYTWASDTGTELTVGNDTNGREAYPLRVEGSRVVLEHRFVAGAAGATLVAVTPVGEAEAR